MSMQPVSWPEPDPQIAAAIAAKYPGKRPRPLAVQVRDRLGEWLHDDQFADAFGTRGRPGWSPSRLALVTVLQRAENLTDRPAAEAVRTRIDWQYLLGLRLDDPGFDHTVLAEFRARVAGGGLEQVALDALLERLAAEGLVRAGGKQRTDSTHVIAAVAALNRLELAGESVRAALEALTAAHPDWVAQRICVSDWARRYGTPVTSWRPPASKAKQDELAVAYARDGYALLEAVYDDSSPAWLAEIPAVDVLRRVLLQNYARVTRADGREVIRRREKEPDGDGLPPGHMRIASPYDLDARWGVKRDTFWLGYKLHVTETCDDEPRCGCPGDGQAGRRGHDQDCAAPAFPNLITHVATTDATVTDNQMTGVIDDELAAKTLAPGRHYVDSGYLSAALAVSEAARHGIALVGPLLADTSAQARAGAGYARADFTVNYGTKTVTCPQGKTSASWTPCAQRGNAAIVATFAVSDCGPCPARALCTTSGKKRRQLTVLPRDLAEAQAAARASEKTIPFQADYARRAGVEGTMHQAATHGARRARYRGLPKTRLDHAYMAVALNLLRLEAYWNGTPLDRQRTSHLARLELDLAALPRINHQDQTPPQNPRRPRRRATLTRTPRDHEPRARHHHQHSRHDQAKARLDTRQSTP
jgi:transposase